MAIVHVVLAVALMTFLVGSFQASVRSQVADARRLEREARAEALAEGGLQLAIAEIAASRPQDVKPGRRLIDLPGGRVEVTIRDLGGLVDLNHATPTLLTNLLLAAGADGGTARQFATAIVARRGDRRFIDEAEIGRLHGMSSALQKRLLPAVTVHGGSRIIDPAASSRLVLTALAGGDIGRVERYLAARRRGGRLVPMQAADAGPVIGSGFEIEAAAPLPDQRRLSRMAVIKPAPFQNAGSLVIVDWRAGRDGR